MTFVEIHCPVFFGTASQNIAKIFLTLIEKTIYDSYAITIREEEYVMFRKSAKTLCLFWPHRDISLSIPLFWPHRDISKRDGTFKIFQLQTHISSFISWIFLDAEDLDIKC